MVFHRSLMEHDYSVTASPIIIFFDDRCNINCTDREYVPRTLRVDDEVCKFGSRNRQWLRPWLFRIFRHSIFNYYIMCTVQRHSEVAYNSCRLSDTLHPPFHVTPLFAFKFHHILEKTWSFLYNFRIECKHNDFTAKYYEVGNRRLFTNLLYKRKF